MLLKLSGDHYLYSLALGFMTGTSGLLAVKVKVRVIETFVFVCFMFVQLFVLVSGMTFYSREIPILLGSKFQNITNWLYFQGNTWYIKLLFFWTS